MRFAQPRWKSTPIAMVLLIAACSDDGTTPPPVVPPIVPSLSSSASITAPDSVYAGDTFVASLGLSVSAQRGTAVRDSARLTALDVTGDTVLMRLYAQPSALVVDSLTMVVGGLDLRVDLFASASSPDTVVYGSATHQWEAAERPRPDSIAIRLRPEAWRDPSTANTDVRVIVRSDYDGKDYALNNDGGQLIGQVPKGGLIRITPSDTVNVHRIEIPDDPETAWHDRAEPYFNDPARVYQFHMLVTADTALVFDTGTPTVSIPADADVEGVLYTVYPDPLDGVYRPGRVDFQGTVEMAARDGSQVDFIDGGSSIDFHGLFVPPHFGLPELLHLLSRGGHTVPYRADLVEPEHEDVWNRFAADNLALFFDPSIPDVARPFAPGQLQFHIAETLEGFSSFSRANPPPTVSLDWPAVGLHRASGIEGVQLMVKHPFAREGNIVRRDPTTGFVYTYGAGMTGPIIYANTVHSEQNLWGFTGETTWWSIVQGGLLHGGRSCHLKYVHPGPDCPRLRDVEGRVSSLPLQTEEAYLFLLPFARVKWENQINDTDHGNVRLLESDAPLWYGGSTPPWYR